ncbi:MAG: protein sip-5 [Gammaproteobacteria bacterium]|nr:protein sip-5 [Gammaproteobacteria bacterium]
MSFKHLKRRVERGEALVEGRARQTGECQARLQREWRQAWTPLRIVVAGLGAGFITGRVQPEQAIGRIGKLAGPGTMQLLTSAVGLVGSLQAAFAAMKAKGAAETADEAAESAGQAAGQANAGATGQADALRAAAPAGPEPATAGPEPSRRRDESWDSQPSPAEAATELSER